MNQAAFALGQLPAIIAAHDPGPAPGEVGWRVELDLLDGRIHAITRLTGAPFMVGHEYNPYPGRSVFEIWGPDDEDAIRSHTRKQIAKRLQGFSGIERGRETERAVAADVECPECGLLGAHRLVCPRYGRT